MDREKAQEQMEAERKEARDGVRSEERGER
jgi:hypothetical protein